MRDISKKTGKSLTSIRYWFKKYGLLPKKNPNINSIITKKKICPKCNTEKDIRNFYKRKGILFGSVYCRECTNSSTVERMNLFKSKCVDYKGGCCQNCGYNRDPTSKDFTIAHMRSYSFDDIVKFELDKCVLLCSNCHREVENGITLINQKEESN